jgi:hypothetical protein
MRAPATNVPLDSEASAAVGQFKNGGQLTENFELDRLIAPTRVDDDLLDEFSDPLEFRLPVFLAPRMACAVFERIFVLKVARIE